MYGEFTSQLELLEFLTSRSEYDHVERGSEIRLFEKSGTYR
jgi:hypothetical protein